MSVAYRFKVLLLAVVCAFFAMQGALAHPGHYASFFHAYNLDDAKRLADKEYKLVFVHVRKANGRRLKLLRYRTAENDSLLDWLVRETIITQLEVKRDADQLSVYDVSPPAVLLLDSKGGLLSKIEGDLSSSFLAEKVMPYFSDSNAVQRVRQALESKGKENFFFRERLGAVLSEAGLHKQALEIYDWCARKAILGESVTAEARRPKLFAFMAAYADKYPVAEKRFKKYLSYAEDYLRDHPENIKLADDLGKVYAFRKDTKHALALFNQLERGSPARLGLLDLLIDDLVNAGRGAQVLELIEPIKAFRGEAALYKRNKILRPAWAEKGSGRGTRSFVVQRATAFTRALADANNEIKTRKLVKQLLHFDNRLQTRDNLKRFLDRSGRSHWLEN
ncbi:MAG: hypothetical protein GY874_12815 [Desulfobacteraceae bacterium]|nr:hypothetical protein [Desulfobacteraceae bacterium]